jgi:hypothetical protein
MAYECHLTPQIELAWSRTLASRRHDATQQLALYANRRTPFASIKQSSANRTIALPVVAALTRSLRLSRRLKDAGETGRDLEAQPCGYRREEDDQSSLIHAVHF